MTKMLERLKDKRIIDRIERERKNSPLNEYFELIAERLKGLHFQELGGSVRDAVISEWYGAPFSLRDFDLIVDDSKKSVDLFKLCEGLPGKIRKNFFGNVRWEVNNYEMDITKYSSENGGNTLENFISGADFNIGTIAYCREHEVILSLNCLEGIRNREISLIKPSEKRPEATLVRAYNFERRLGFKLNRNIMDYIQQTYTPSMDSKILEYLKYKKMPEEIFPLITRRLRELQL